jgi:hypothetical protein
VKSGQKPETSGAAALAEPERPAEQAPLVLPSPRAPLTAARLVQLQRLVGNAAVSALVDERKGPAADFATTIAGPLGPSILDDLAAAGEKKGADGGEAAGAESKAGGAEPDAVTSAGAPAGPHPDAVSSAAAAGPGSADAKAVADPAADPDAVSSTAAGTEAAASGAAKAQGEAKIAEDGVAAAGGDAKASAAAAFASAGVAAGAGVAEEAKAGEGAAAESGIAGAALAGAEGAAAGAAGAALAGPLGAIGGAAGALAAPVAAAGSASAGAAGPGAAGPASAGGVAEAKASSGAAAAAPTKDPHSDPNFQAMKGKAAAAAAGSKQHEAPHQGAAAAQAAALPPANDLQSQAQAAQVDTMSGAQAAAFDRAGFIAAVKAAIEKTAPKNLEDADDYKADGVKDAVTGQVKQGKDGAQQDIKTATDQAPDPSKGTPKPVTPMGPEEIGQAPGSVGAAGAMPGPASPQQTDLSAGPDAVDQQMSDAQVTEPQLQNSNEPDFKAALGAKDAAADHADKAPAGYRKQEADELAKAHGAAGATEVQQLAGMHGARSAGLAKAGAHKQGAKSQDEAKRAKVASDIQGLYDRTKGDVTKTLDGLDGKVDGAFTAGEAAARKRFEDYVSQKMDAYKDDRYSGLLGGARWLKDKLMGLPGEVNQFYADGKTRYLADMDQVIGKVADVVGAELTAARARIAQGKAEVHQYVMQLPQDLQQVGKEAESDLASQFEQLSSDVDAKQNDLVDELAKKYVDARDALDARIDEMKAANKGLVDKAIDAVGGVIKTILQLKNLLLSVLAKAADVIGEILADPIGFLGKLVDGVKAGLNRFMGNIGAHLQEGLMGWLFGTLGGAGIEIPKTFDLSGIVDLVLQVLGLTYRAIRARVVKIIGEPLMARMEQTVDVFKTLAGEGIAGLWRFIKDKVGDFEDLVLGSIKTFLIEKVIKAGIFWLIAFLNPAAAFIKAVKAIIDIVQFLMERGSEIMSFVSSITDSLGAIAKGALGIVAEKVEGSLAKALPLAISFLASLLGLGGISEKIHEVIDKVRAPINKAIDFVVMGAVKGFKKLFGGAAKWAKGKFQQGKDWAKGKVDGAKAKLRGGDDSPEGRDARLKAAAGDAVNTAKGMSGRISKTLLSPALAVIRTRYGLKKLLPFEKDGTWWVQAEINPILVVDSGVPSGKRQPEGPNFQPINGKLTQVVQMLTAWASRPVRPAQRDRIQQMLRETEVAREEAQFLAEAQAKGTFLPDVDARRATLSGRLRNVQTLDPHYALVSVGELSITITNVKRQMPALALTPWTMLDPALRAEYVRQLRDQQDGINSMTVDQWEGNRTRFTTSGRSAQGTKLQATFGRRTPRNPGDAAPHNPDQIAGGFDDPTGLPAANEVNSHIGSQWPGRIGAVDAATAALEPTDKLITQMNVQMTV